MAVEGTREPAEAPIPPDGVMKRARVLVVDDSAFARKVLRESLNRSLHLEVVGIARDGLEALEKIVELSPEVITLDLEMPNLDGIGVLRALRAAKSTARVVIVCNSHRHTDVVVEALRLGAFDVVTKPTSLATDVLYGLADELVEIVEQAARAPAGGGPSGQTPARVVGVVAQGRAQQVELVVIGASTGGPYALARLLPMLPADFPVPIAIALHIPSEYTTALARRLNDDCRLRVVEANESDDTPLVPGVVVIARGGAHLRIVRRGGRLVARTTQEPRNADYFPSVDLLFETAASSSNGGTLGVVLTGMGSDGVKGARAIVATGGRVVTEAESTCVVYGMPRSVAEVGLSAGELPLDDIAAELVRRAQPHAHVVPSGNES